MGSHKISAACHRHRPRPRIVISWWKTNFSASLLSKRMRLLFKEQRCFAKQLQTHESELVESTQVPPTAEVANAPQAKWGNEGLEYQ